MRRYVFTLEAVQQIDFPVLIEKSESPDFRCKFGTRDVGIEVTTATTTEDEDAITQQEIAGRPALVGSHKGRKPIGNPEVAWLSDVIEAAKSKSQDIAKYRDPLLEHVVLIQSGGNPTSLIDDDHWPKEFQYSWLNIDQIWQSVDPRLKSVAVICGGCWLLIIKRDGITPYALQLS
jgi:hypothetical protein